LRGVGRNALAAAAAIGRNGREQVGALDAVLSREGVDVQRRDTQVAVVSRATWISCRAGSWKNCFQPCSAAAWAGAWAGEYAGPAGTDRHRRFGC
jgi:hypothetical protein